MAESFRQRRASGAAQPGPGVRPRAAGRLCLATLALVLAAVTSSCGQQHEGASVSGSAAPELVAAVPESVKADGTLLVATDPSVGAPTEFLDKDNTTIIGMDADLANAIAGKLGLRARITPVHFADIRPGVRDGKYEIGMSAMFVTNERLAEVDMVSYLKAGTAIAAKAGNPKGVARDNLCGLRVAVQAQTVHSEAVKKLSTLCVAQGRPPVVHNGDQYPLGTDALRALTTGRADAVEADSTTLDYFTSQSNGALQPVGQSYDNKPYGIAVPKTAEGEQLATAIQRAIESLILSGRYEEILRKWAVENGRLPSLRIDVYKAHV
jgi:polar amino acid transport system substrate-binding protein